LSETYGHVLPSQALHSAIYGDKQRSAVFTEIRLIKKEEKHAQSITAFRTGIRRTGGCNKYKMSSGLSAAAEFLSLQYTRFETTQPAAGLTSRVAKKIRHDYFNHFPR